MMSFSQDPIVRRGFASSPTYANGNSYTGTATTGPQHCSKFNYREGHMNGVIHSLTDATKSINHRIPNGLDSTLETALDRDNVTSTVSVVTLKGKFENVGSVSNSVKMTQLNANVGLLTETHDTNFNSLISNHTEQSTLATADQDVTNEMMNPVVTINTNETRTDVTAVLDSDNELSGYEEECRAFMQDLVQRIFHESGSITQMDNHLFDEYCRTAEGRKWFARIVDSKRIYNKMVEEQTFYRLVQFFAVCLFECKEADDFTPAKNLMNMCFTFYHEQEGLATLEELKYASYLYSHLSNQNIWREHRFWTAAFMDAVHSKKKKRMPVGRENWRKQTPEERENTELLHENITFGQLAAFTHNMMHLGLPRSMCEQFVDKQSIIGDLHEYQIAMILGNIEAHYKVDKSVNSLQKSFNKFKFKIPGIL